MGFRLIRIGALEVLLSLETRDASRTAVPAGLQPDIRALPEHGREDEVGSTTPGTGTARDTAAVSEIDWYHTIDLPGGVVTPGAFDHRRYVHRYGLPERLDGMRVLDVATYDGFWAFEMERRGAAEVVALDIETFAQLDLPPSVRRAATPADLERRIGRGFELASDLLGSRVRRVTSSIYDLSPDELGTFDLVFLGSLLLHLTNPVRALQNVASVTAGSAVIAECYHPMIPSPFARYQGGKHNCVWWHYSLGALEQMIADAGFSRIELVDTFDLMDRSEKQAAAHAVFHAFP